MQYKVYEWVGGKDYNGRRKLPMIIAKLIKQEGPISTLQLIERLRILGYELGSIPSERIRNIAGGLYKRGYVSCKIETKDSLSNLLVKETGLSQREIINIIGPLTYCGIFPRKQLAYSEEKLIVVKRAINLVQAGVGRLNALRTALIEIYGVNSPLVRIFDFERKKEMRMVSLKKRRENQMNLHYLTLLEQLTDPIVYSGILNELSDEFYRHHKNFFKSPLWNLYFKSEGIKEKDNESRREFVYKQLEHSLPPVPVKQVDFNDFKESVFARLEKRLNTIPPLIRMVYERSVDRLYQEKPRLAEVIKRLYLNGRKTLEEVGNEIGVTTRERSRQLRDNALKKLNSYEEIRELKQMLFAT